MKRLEIMVVEGLTKAGLVFGKHYDEDTIEFAVGKIQNKSEAWKTIDLVVEHLIEHWNESCELGEEIQ